MRQSYLVAGVERSGKTFWAENLANMYVKTGRPAVLYNAGMDKDFKDAEICNPITLSMLARKLPKQKRFLVESAECLEFFQDEKTGRIYPFKFFRQFYAGKKVKIYAIDGERFLFESIFRYVYDTLIIFDDIRATTRQGLSKEFIRLLSRKNHSGHRNAPEGQTPGIDTIFIYHSLDTPPPELFDYCTRIILFRLMRVPSVRIKNEELYAVICESVEALKTLPKYSNIEMILREYENIETIINKS